MNNKKSALRIIGLTALGLTTLLACDAQVTTDTDSALAMPTASFSTQADAGATAYANNCAVCHGADLQGSALGPMLSGNGFVGSWGRRSPADFFVNIMSNMPPGDNANISD